MRKKPNGRTEKMKELGGAAVGQAHELEHAGHRLVALAPGDAGHGQRVGDVLGGGALPRR